MSDPTLNFGGIAQKLARNPLGIIALFIVLVYGFAALVTGLASSFTQADKLPLIYFLVVFPVLVLAAFAWLVSRHSNSLFAPSDFRNEDSYLRALTASASLAVASVKDESSLSAAEIHSVVASVQEASADSAKNRDNYKRNHVLWVDDRPGNNINERRALEAMGASFTLALSTNEALERISEDKFAAII